MKKTTAIFVALSLTLGGIGTAQADWGRHGGGHHPHHEYREHHRGGGWAGPAALLAITGLAIGAAAYSHATPAPVYSAPVYSPPPPPVQVIQEGSWYYCGSSGQYYPYVRNCPEGWQAVMPPR